MSSNKAIPMPQEITSIRSTQSVWQHRNMLPINDAVKKTHVDRYQIETSDL